LNANNFIEAIKSVRTLGHNRYEVRQGINGQVILEPVPSVGLKEAKDFIEEVMAMGVRRYLQEQINDSDRKLADRIREREYQARREQSSAFISADDAAPHRYDDNIKF
jgi:phage terminase small subunit